MEWLPPQQTPGFCEPMTHYCNFIFTYLSLGIQVCVYIAKFRGLRPKSNAFGKCEAAWHD